MGEGREMKRRAMVFIKYSPWVAIGIFLASELHKFVQDMTPPSYWFDVTGVTVADSRVGEPIVMNVTRTINRPFSGSWVASVRKMTPRGLELQCSAYGRNEYLVESLLPAPLTLDWWTNPIKCDLPVGRYRLDTVWTIEVPSHEPKIVSAQSNVFDVRP
jgi:hypothetical protein